MLEPADLDRYRRETAAMIGKATADDLASLALVHGLLVDAVESMPMAIYAQMRAERYSWEDVAQAFGITRSWAYRKFRPTVTARAAQARMFRKITAPAS